MRDCVNCPNKKWQVVDKQPRMYCGYLGKEVKLAEGELKDYFLEIQKIKGGSHNELNTNTKGNT